MKLIDLICKISAPTAAGLIITLASSTAAAIYVGVAALLFVSAEYFVLRWVYARVPELSKDTTLGHGLAQQEQGGAAAAAAAEQGGYGAVAEDAEGGEETKAAPPADRALVQGGKQPPKAATPAARRSALAQLTCYFSQTAAPAAFALAVIYFTVLDFGALMTAYLKLRGLDAAYLGAARGVGAIFGVVASVTFPLFRRCMQLKPSALAAIWIQLVCISPSLAVLVWPFHDTANRAVIASWLLIAGVITSRFGLWLFDLSVSQIMQETVPEHERGVVGGVQVRSLPIHQLAASLPSALPRRPDALAERAPKRFPARNVHPRRYIPPLQRVRVPHWPLCRRRCCCGRPLHPDLPKDPPLPCLKESGGVRPPSLLGLVGTDGARSCRPAFGRRRARRSQRLRMPSVEDQSMKSVNEACTAPVERRMATSDECSSSKV